MNVFARPSLIPGTALLLSACLGLTAVGPRAETRADAPKLLEAPHTEKPKGDNAAYDAFRSGQYKLALQLAEKAAKQGEPAAYTLVGKLYAGGLGVPRDLTRAAQWYAGGAERGDPDSQHALGVQLMEGQGVKRDPKQAATLFEAAAARGHAAAQYSFGVSLATGSGRKPDVKKAAEWFQKAADQNHPNAQYDLGALYRMGEGVPLDEDRAARWIGLAAQNGLVAAELEYGLMLYLGKGVVRNEQRGAQFLLSAARKGNPVAQNRVARLYAHGLVFDRDLVEAAKWHLLARARGVSDMRLDLWVAKLPADKRRKAEKLADDWRARANYR